MSDYGYRVIQDGMTVASAFGEDERAKAEGFHYARLHAQDGPVELQRKAPGGRWKSFAQVAVGKCKPVLRMTDTLRTALPKEPGA